MFFQGLLSYQVPHMEAFIKYKVSQIRQVMLPQYNGFIPRVEAPYIIRYFLQFPSRRDEVDEILVEIGKLESLQEKSKELLEEEAFSKYLISILKTNKFSAYPQESLIESFRVLDTEKNGYLDLHTYYTFLKRYGVCFSKENIDEMEKFLLENENELLEPIKMKGDERVEKNKNTISRKFYYENYVRKVLGDNQMHFDMLMKEFEEFYNYYVENGKYPESEKEKEQPQPQVPVQQPTTVIKEEKEEAEKEEKKVEEQKEQEQEQPKEEEEKKEEEQNEQKEEKK